MSVDILKLEPKELWGYFLDLTKIPRPSGKEAAVIEYLKDFGKKNGLETIVDEVGNVIIRKPATPGMQNRAGVILQGHLDMVPQKNSDKVHDFEKDPIEARINGEWVTANGTTLGADNGIGVAATLAVLASKTLQHGPVEALFTIDEETGMTGAFGLKPGLIEGSILMNLDSEDEGELYVGCAGGTNANMQFEFSKATVPAGATAFKLSITGLKGGHSGVDIPLGRGNSNKLMFRFLFYAEKEFGLRLSSIDGGSLRNAIPRETFATIVVPSANADDMIKCISKFEEIFRKELLETEPDLSFKAEKISAPHFLIDEKTQHNLIKAIYGAPNAVIRMSSSMKNLVETSTNLAIVKSDDKEINVLALLRSSVDSAKQDLENMFECVFTLAGAKVVFDGQYPGWKPNMSSAILKTMSEIYNNKFGKVPEIRAIHAGLECGLLGGVYPNWDMISFGPTIRFPHSPDEKVNIESVNKFWIFLVETLKNIPVK